MWTIFTGYMTVASMRTTGALTAAFVVVLATVAVLTIGELTQNTTVVHVAGFLGIAAAALA